MFAKSILRPAVLALAVAGALVSAIPAAAATSPACAGDSLDPQGFLSTGTQSITLRGTASCTTGAAAPQAAQLTLSGTATVSSCFQSPYIGASGTLTTALADGRVFTSTAVLTINPDAGTSESVGSLSTAAGQTGLLSVGFSDAEGGSIIGLISRCGGGDFTFHAAGAIAPA
jgi:hypothetical protein